MTVPGSNILNQALSVLGKQTVTYFKNTGRTKTTTGLYVAQYAPGVPVSGSFQPVRSSKYQYLGLDLEKNYWNFYVSRKVLDLQRDISGDQLEFQGKRYQCESCDPWAGVDGWDMVRCVEIKNA